MDIEVRIPVSERVLVALLPRDYEGLAEVVGWLQDAVSEGAYFTVEDLFETEGNLGGFSS